MRSGPSGFPTRPPPATSAAASPEADVLTLMDAINASRLRVWAQQPPEFFAEAILEADGSIVPSDAECKRGMDFAYDGQYGYHPLVISLANTAEPLYLLNRSGNRPSQEQADVFLDKAIALCRRAGFRRILMRGDTKFAQTRHLDRWDEAGDIRFVFGYEAYDSLKARADDLPAASYRLLRRPPRYRSRPPRARSPSGSSRRSSASAATRTSSCSRRWWRSSPIGRRPARRAIG